MLALYLQLRVYTFSMKQLIDEGELNDSIDEKAFSAFFERFSIGDVIVHIDTEFLFKVLDRSEGVCCFCLIFTKSVNI